MKKLSFLLICLITFLCFSCAMEGNPQDMSCWVTIEETGIEQLRVRVRLEDSTGNVPNGARVLFETPDRELIWVYFNSAANMYEASVSEVISGEYIVKVNSAVGDISMKCPVIILKEEPEVILLQDANGISAGQGKKLSATADISLKWNLIDNAAVYKGSIYSGVSLVHVFSSTESNYTIPSNTLEANKSYTLVIEAQYISGDPYLEKEPYYVFSYSQGSDYYFSLE
jgi:hypothetical protein